MRSFRSWILLSACFIPPALWIPGSLAQSPAPPAPLWQPERVARDIEAMMARWGEAAARLDAPGFSVAIVHRAQIVFSGAWGAADPLSDRPMTPSSIAYIASATKPFVATAVLLLAGEGLIDLDAPVSRYVPEFTLANVPAADRVTVRSLLSHTAGLRPPPPVVLGTSYTGSLDTAGVLAMLPHTEASLEYRYDNIHYILLGVVVERVTGRSWQEEVARRILDPVQMADSGTSIEAMRAAHDHADAWVRGTSGWHPAEPRKQQSMMSAAGGVTASALDLARWLMLNLGAGRLEGRGLVAPGAVTASWGRAAATEPLERLGIVQDGYGLGWERGTFAGRDVVMHTGDFPGCHAHLSFIPDSDIGVVVLVNAGVPALGWIIASDVYRATLAPEMADPVPLRLERADRERDERRAAAEPPSPDELLGPTQRSRPIETYAGDYRDPLLGVLRIGVESGHLHAMLGALPLHLRSTDQPDSAEVSIAGRPATAVFQIDDRGVFGLNIQAGPFTFQFARQE